MEVKIVGQVKKIFEVQSFKNDFKKQTVIVDCGDTKYPSPIPVDFIKTGIEAVSGLKEGEQVEVSCRLGGREWTPENGDPKYFISLTGLSVSFLDGKLVDDDGNVHDLPEEDDDDVPF